MRYATFVNFDSESFTGFWNGKPYTFQPGEKKEHLRESIAAHFAKHLANKVLTRTGKERYTSPKKPNDVPEFMEVFNKAFYLEGSGAEVDAETGLPVDGTAGARDIGNPDQPGSFIRTTPRAPIGGTPGADPYDANASQQFGPGGKPQVIGSDDAGASDDDESSFEGQ